MPTDTISDFPDRLSPMLVKELRQGLRAKTFVAVFLAFQGLLSLILLSASASGASGNVGTIISTVIFIFFAIAVLIIQPLRGIGAISSEMKGNTLDMMMLTRLSTSRIILGKWFAIVSQSALILATVIPYLIFRYFLGEMNLIGEIVLLILIFLTSMTLTAVTVGLSASSSVILRILLPLVGIPVLGIFTLQIIIMASFRGGASILDYCSLVTPGSRYGILLFIIALAYSGWSMLSMGTSIISPAAENHATLRRVITLMVTLAVCVAVVVVPNFEMELVPILVAFVAAPAFATALTERSFVAPSVVSRFGKWGVFGKPGRIFLFPGWPSGVWFTLLISVIFAATIHIDWSGVYIQDEHQARVMAMIATLLFPAVIVTYFKVEEASRISAYLLILIGSIIFSVVIYSISQALDNDGLLWFFVWNPFNFIFILEEHPPAEEMIPAVAAAVVIIYFGLLGTASIVTSVAARRAAASTEAA